MPRVVKGRFLFLLANALAASLLLGLFSLSSQQVIEGYPNDYPNGTVTSLLVERAQWTQGSDFPGRVMALYRAGSIEALSPADAGRTWQNSEGLTADLLSLKVNRVTTFAPYGQLTSLGLYREAHDLFGNPEDVTTRNSIINRRFDLTAARLFGIKFVLADSSLSGPGLRQIATTDGAPIVRLYEVDDPNTSGFAPTDLQFATDWAGVRETLARPDFDPRASAVLLENGPNADQVPGLLGRLQSSAIRLAGSGIEIDAQLANPQAPALVVLPFEFSHCMTVWSVSGQLPAELVPVNGILTGLVVSESGRYEIQALTSPLRTPLCRLKDIQWWKRLFAAPS
jgi:hypothetical protein